MTAAHKLVANKTFGWSRLFADLEAVMPGSVSASRIAVENVYQDGDRIKAALDFAVLARDFNAVQGMIKNMDDSGLFRAELRGQDLQKNERGTFTEYTFRLIYTPSYGYAAAPPADVAENQEACSKCRNSSRNLSNRPKRSLRPPRPSRLNRPRKVYAGMWGPPEIVVVAAGALALAGMVVLYVLGVVPGSRELARNKSEAERLDAEVLSATSKYGEITDTSTQVNKILGSVDDFETRFLAAQSNGLASLYQRLNGLIRGYGLVNTTGPITFRSSPST